MGAKRAVARTDASQDAKSKGSKKTPAEKPAKPAKPLKGLAAAAAKASAKKEGSADSGRSLAREAEAPAKGGKKSVPPAKVATPAKAAKGSARKEGSADGGRALAREADAPAKSGKKSAPASEAKSGKKSAPASEAKADAKSGKKSAPASEAKADAKSGKKSASEAPAKGGKKSAPASEAKSGKKSASDAKATKPAKGGAGKEASADGGRALVREAEAKGGKKAAKPEAKPGKKAEPNKASEKPVAEKKAAPAAEKKPAQSKKEAAAATKEESVKSENLATAAPLKKERSVVRIAAGERKPRKVEDEKPVQTELPLAVAPAPAPVETKPAPVVPPIKTIRRAAAAKVEINPKLESSRGVIAPPKSQAKPMSVAEKRRNDAEAAFSKVAPTVTTPAPVPQNGASNGAPGQPHKSSFEMRISERDSLTTTLRLTESRETALGAARELAQRFKLPPDQVLLVKIISLNDPGLTKLSLEELLELDDRGRVRRTPELKESLDKLKSDDRETIELKDLLLEKMGSFTG